MPPAPSSSRDQRRRTLGIDCHDRVVWKSWEPGEELVRRVVLKNVESRALVITCGLPQHKTVFLTPYPEPVTLRGGMSYELEIRFKPTEAVELRDRIEVDVEGRGSFSIHLECMTPFAKLRVPAAHDFDVCPVYGTVTHEMTVQNSGTVPLSYYWDAPHPFDVVPHRGALEPGESTTVTLTFSPEEARVMVAQAVCRMAEIEEVVATVRLSGIGKLPYTRLVFPAAADGEEPVAVRGNGKRSFLAPLFPSTAEGVSAASQAGIIDFGRVAATGPSTTALFTVQNPSPVPATITVQRLDDALVCPFSVTPVSSGQPKPTRPAGPASAQPFELVPGTADAVDVKAGVTVRIPSGGSQTFKVTCKVAGLPAGLALRNEFQLQTAAASPLRIELTAVVAGARLRTSATAVDFGNVNLDARAAGDKDSALIQTVDLRNSGDAPAAFNVLATSPGAAFTVEPLSGVVAASGHVRLRVQFNPSFPMNYLRRLYIVVEGAADALFLDVFGTAYNGHERALPFGLREVEAYHRRMSRGLGCLGPTELTALAAVANGEDREHALSDDEETLVHAWRNLETELGARTDIGGTSFLEKRSNRVDFDTLVSDVFFFSTVGGTARATGRCPYAIECKSPLVFGDVAGANSRPSTANGAAAAAHVVSVLNTSNTAARASWCVPTESPFTVVPEQQEVMPGESAQFQVRLKEPDSVPIQSVVAQLLECYVHPACTASFRLIEREGFVPPTCFTVPCQLFSNDPLAPGMTPGSANEWIRTPPLAVFTPCPVNQCGYVVAALENTSDTALTYQLASVTMQEVSELVVDDLSVLLTLQDGTTKSLTVAEANAQFPPEGLRRAATVRASARATFSCFPAQGVLPPRSQTLVLLHFLPPDLARYDAKAVFAVNQNERDLAYIPMRAEASLPRLRLAAVAGVSCLGAAESRFVMAPTCVTGEASLSLTLVNPSSQPVAFRAEPSEGLISAVRCEPAYGVLPPGERLDASVYFSPEEVGVYDGMVSYVLRAAASATTSRGAVVEEDAEESLVDPAIAAAVALAVPAGLAASQDERLSLPHSLDGTSVPASGGTTTVSPVTVREYVLSVPFKGEGVPARVELEPSVVDCRVDEMVAKSGDLHPTVPITLFNSGLCAVQYEVGVLVVRGGDDEVNELAGSPPAGAALALRYHVGQLPARTHATVLLTIDARAVHGVCEYIVYTLVAGMGTRTSLVASPKTVVEATRHPHCRVTLRGLRPALQITDVRSLTQQRSLLWRQLAINDINESLAASVEPEDRLAQESYAFPEYIAGLQPIPVDLGVGEPDMVPTIVSLLVENSGDCPTSFEVLLPTDCEAQEETWFVPDEALKDMRDIIDNATIEITPRRGTVPVGGAVVVTLTYRFHAVGVHTLPVLLRVHDGRRVLLVLEGRTLPAEVNAVALHHGSTYTLLPVALGELEPPMQGIVLENPYDRPVEYHVQTAALRRLADENCGFPILQCVNPSGVLAPRSVVQLLWYFRPLEAKEYVMDVAVDVVGGESYALTFVASGYHPHHIKPADVRAAIAKSFLRLPALPRLSLFPALPVRLSQDVCALGAVPYFSLHRRTVWLENHHPTHIFSFLWDTRHTSGNHVVRVVPESGVLEAGGGRAACKIIFYAGSTSQMLEWPATCMITNETKLKESELMMAPQQAATATAVDAASSRGADVVDSIDVPLETEAGAKAPARRRRQPVAAPTLKSMGVRALTREVEQARRRQRAVETQVRFPGTAARCDAEGHLVLTRTCVDGTATTTTVGDGAITGIQADAELADMEEAAVVWNALELLIQARVMPVDDYELYYGSEALAQHYMPPLVRHELPRGSEAIPASRQRHAQQMAALWSSEVEPEAAAQLTRDGVQLVRGALDDMLRTLVSDRRVTKAMVEPYVPAPVTYAALVAAAAVGAERNHTAEAAVDSTVDRYAPVAAGTVTNAVEEALDSVLYDALTAAVDEMVQSLAVV